MRQYYIKNLEFQGYRKFNHLQRVDFSVPNSVDVGSGLNLIVGSVGSGKTSMMEVIAAVCGRGLIDNDRLAINDGILKGEVPMIGADFISSDYESKIDYKYTRRSDFKIEGRLIQVSFTDEIDHLDQENRPDNQGMKYIRANRLFRGDQVTPPHPIGDDIVVDIDQLNRVEYISFAVLTHILQDINRIGYGSRLNDFISKVRDLRHVGLEVEDIRIGELGRNAAGLGPFEVKLTGGEWHNAQDLSDGTKELLCWIYELNFGLTSRSPIVCIDEIERSLHPQIQSILLETIYQRSAHQQYFLTTHSIHIADQAKIGRLHRLSSDGMITSIARSDFPLQAVFTPDHRRLFFTDKAIFVEGNDDIQFYRQKILDSPNAQLLDHLFQLGGKDNVDHFEKICKALNITFAAIVDDDFSDKTVGISSGNMRFLAKALKLLEAKGVEDLPDINALAVELTGEQTIRSIRKAALVTDKSYRKVTRRNIYPLIHGRYEEYRDGINRNDDDVSSEQALELNEIFQAIADL